MTLIQNSRVWLPVTLLLAAGSPVLATDYSWTMQSIGASPTYGDMPALAMGRGHTWPTAFYGSGGSLKASSLTPAGWMDSTIGQRYQPMQAIRARARGDGQVAVISTTPTGISLIQSSKTGWQTASFAANNMAIPDFGYFSTNLPVVAYAESGTYYLKTAAYDGSVWNTETVSIGGGSISSPMLSLATDSLDRTALAYVAGSGVGFAMKDPVAGTWQKYTAPSGQTDYLAALSGVSSISLAVGPHDQTAMLVQQGSGALTYAWFDVRSGIWKTEMVLANGAISTFSNLAFDGTGTPAFAYVLNTGSNNLHYRKKVGLGWADITLPATASGGGYNSASLAFDAENLPVIAFRNNANYLTLAYDPIELPEPAAGLLLLVGLTILRRRGRGN